MVTTPQPNQHQPLWLNCFDTALLFIIVVSTGLRPLLSEVITTNWPLSQQPQIVPIANATTPIVLFFSVCHISLLSIWLFVHAFATKQWAWRKTTMVPGFILMIVAFGVSTISAGNQHIAIVSGITWLSHFAIGILLVQLLRHHWHKLLIIGILIFVAAMMSYRCWEQATYEMPQLVQQVADHPNDYLKQQGIMPDTFKAAHFLKRVASMDIGGYYIISNTTAAFFILTFCGIVGFMIYAIQHTSSKDKMFNIVLAMLVLGFLALGIRYTESKGGIASLLIVIGGMIVVATIRPFLIKHLRKVLMTIIILIISAISGIVIYGITTRSLPGNSMLVRWQYWEGVIDIGHFATGVGSFNFLYHYLTHMSPGAPETVQDPHNIYLSFLSQWGILGLGGFLSIFVLLFYHLKDIVSNTTRCEIKLDWGNNDLKKYIGFGTLSIVIITVSRFILTFNSNVVNGTERLPLIIISYLIPSIVGFIAFTFSALMIMKSNAQDGDNLAGDHYHWLPLTASFGIAAFLLQNSIDFALFQPSVGQILFVTIALTMGYTNSYTKADSGDTPRWIKPLALACCLMTATLWATLVIPFSQSHNMIKSAQNDIYAALYDDQVISPRQQKALLGDAIEKTQKAYRLCKLDPAPLKLQCQLISSRFDKQTTVAELNTFQTLLDKAIALSRHNYALYKLGGDVLAPYTNKQTAALTYYRDAHNLYPVYPDLALAYGKLLLASNSDKNIILARAVFTESLKHEAAFKQQAEEMFGDQSSWYFRMPPEMAKEMGSLLEKITLRQQPSP